MTVVYLCNLAIHCQTPEDWKMKPVEFISALWFLSIIISLVWISTIHFWIFTTTQDAVKDKKITKVTQLMRTLYNLPKQPQNHYKKPWYDYNWSTGNQTENSSKWKWTFDLGTIQSSSLIENFIHKFDQIQNNQQCRLVTMTRTSTNSTTEFNVNTEPCC